MSNAVRPHIEIHPMRIPATSRRFRYIYCVIWRRFDYNIAISLMAVGLPKTSGSEQLSL